MGTMAQEKMTDRAARMKALRLACGYPTQTAFAAFLGVPMTRWNAIEMGLPISTRVSQILVQKIPGLSLDWIFNGNEAGLTVAVRDRLRALEERARKSA